MGRFYVFYTTAALSLKIFTFLIIACSPCCPSRAFFLDLFFEFFVKRSACDCFSLGFCGFFTEFCSLRTFHCPQRYGIENLNSLRFTAGHVHMTLHKALSSLFVEFLLDFLAFFIIRSLCGCFSLGFFIFFIDSRSSKAFHRPQQHGTENLISLRSVTGQVHKAACKGPTALCVRVSLGFLDSFTKLDVCDCLPQFLHQISFLGSYSHPQLYHAGNFKSLRFSPDHASSTLGIYSMSASRCSFSQQNTRSTVSRYTKLPYTHFATETIQPRSAPCLVRSSSPNVKNIRTTSCSPCIFITLAGVSDDTRVIISFSCSSAKGQPETLNTTLQPFAERGRTSHTFCTGQIALPFFAEDESKSLALNHCNSCLS